MIRIAGARPMRSGLDSLAASFQAVFVLLKISLQEKLVYRFDTFFGLLYPFFRVLLVQALWIALFNGRQVLSGSTFDQTITYVVLSWILRNMFPEGLIGEVNNRIRTGDIIFDVMRPMQYGYVLFCRTGGQALASLFTRSVPLMIAACLLLHLQLPRSPLVWLAFLISLGCGFVTFFLVDYAVSLLGFWITDLDGIYWAKRTIVSLFAGNYLPLWFFPPGLQTVALMLPFQGMIYTPLAILVGKVPLPQVPVQIGIQLVWIAVLVLLTRLLFARGTRKIAVQGG